MEKRLDFIKECRFYIVLNIILAVWTALVLFTQPLSAIGFFALVLVIYGWWIAVPVFVVLNWLSYVEVCNDRSSGIGVALIGGFLGGFIAAHTANKNFYKTKALNIIFNIYIWIIVIYPVCVGILFLTGFYSLL